MAPSTLWKLALAVALAAAILVSASAEAPRKPLARAELHGLLGAALALYAVGFASLLTHHMQLSVLVFAAGIATSALAAWLSRGRDVGGGPPGDGEPVDGEPPPDPEGLPRFDWAQFERDLLAYTDRRRDPVRSR